MKILLDMNLSPQWVDILVKAGFDTVHWSSIGKPNALDSTIMQWAKKNDHVVFTHDLDFGDILAATNADAPSVIQIRTQNLHPDYFGEAIIAALKQFRAQLEDGALIVVDESKVRARILPIRK
jgi:predicted nuclease of predicted toxin-antitoxin system